MTLCFSDLLGIVRAMDKARFLCFYHALVPRVYADLKHGILVFYLAHFFYLDSIAPLTQLRSLPISKSNPVGAFTSNIVAHYAGEILQVA